MERNSDGAKSDRATERWSNRWKEQRSEERRCSFHLLLHRSVALSLFAPSLFRSIHSSLHNNSFSFFNLYFNIQNNRSVALSICRSVVPSLRCSLLRRSFAPLLFAPSIFRSIHSSLHNHSFYFYFLYFNIQTYPRTKTYEGGRTALRRLAVSIATRLLRDHFFPCTITIMESEKGLGKQNMDFLFGLDML